jgi:hypothetical protein
MSDLFRAAAHSGQKFFAFQPGTSMQICAVGNRGVQFMVVDSCAANRAVAEYIAELTAELARLAAASHHDDLAQILEIARLESERLCGRDQDETQKPPAGNIIFLPKRMQ